jgi:hypothetical protein
MATLLNMALHAAAAEGSSHDVNKLKTKVRRLYDIANILSSLRLLEKTQLPDSRKPAFRWLGIGVPTACTSTATLKDFYRCVPCALCRHSLLRSFEILHRQSAQSPCLHRQLSVERGTSVACFS